MDDSLFKEFKESLSEHVKIARGETKATRRTTIKIPNVHEIRRKLKLTQHIFAKLLGISVWTLRNWEQGRRDPEGPAISLLRIAEKEPQALLRCLS